MSVILGFFLIHSISGLSGHTLVHVYFFVSFLVFENISVLEFSTVLA